MSQKNLPVAIILLRVKEVTSSLPYWKNLFNIRRGQKEGRSLRYLRNEVNAKNLSLFERAPRNEIWLCLLTASD